MDKAALRELAEDLAMNHEYCPKDVILKASDALLNLLAEIQSLTGERTAWRTTAENAEAELKAIKEAEPVAVALRFGTDKRLCLSTVFDTKDEAQEYANSTANGAHLVPLYTLQGESK